MRKQKEKEQEFSKKVGEKIRNIRQINKKTQKELSSLLGISFQQIQKNETGINRISFYRAFLISRIFNLKLEDLVDEDFLKIDEKTMKEKKEVNEAFKLISDFFNKKNKFKS